jgi:hypothetical protein
MRVRRPALAGPRVPRLTLLAALVLFVAVVLSHGSGASLDGLLYLAPALVLAVVLLGRRYPGERVIERLREVRAARPRARVVGAPPPRQRPREHQRGGCLIAVSLAGRAPPLVAGCC